MPELPEIERYKNSIADKGLNNKIKNIEVLDNGVLYNSESRKVKEVLKNAEIEKVDRIGKYLCLQTTNSECVEWHFGMTGLPYFFKNEEKPDYTRVLITYENDLKLAFVDARKLGEMRVVKDKDEIITNHDLGPDALNITKNKFLNLVENSTAMAKTGLMNQSHICGIGNLYSDEILFEAKIYPKSKLKELDSNKLEKLYSTINSVLKKSIKILSNSKITAHYTMSGKEFPDDFLISHRKKGKQCPNCEGTIETMKIGGRTCYYCPECQKEN